MAMKGEGDDGYGCSTSSLPAVRLALLGAGNFANNTYGPILKDIAGVEVRAVWSRSDTSVRSVFDLVSTYSAKVEMFSGEEGLVNVLEKEDVDAVVVILPPKPALEIALRALRKGKHVLQEKPIGTSEEDIARGLDEYSAMGEWRPIWGVAENYRFEDVYLNAKKLISERLGGEVIHINLSASLALNDSSCYWHTPWRHSEEDCPGGYLFEGPVHFMAALRMLAGQSTGTGGEITCSAVAESRNQELKQLDTLAGWIKFDTKPKSTTCSISITYAAVVPRVVFNLTCSGGNLEIERVPGKYVVRMQPKGAEEEERIEFPFSGIKNEIEYFKGAVQRHTQIAENGFHRTVGFTDQHFPDISASEGFKDVQCLRALLRAAETGRVQKVE